MRVTSRGMAARRVREGSAVTQAAPLYLVGRSRGPMGISMARGVGRKANGVKKTWVEAAIRDRDGLGGSYDDGAVCVAAR